LPSALNFDEVPILCGKVKSNKVYNIEKDKAESNGNHERMQKLKYVVIIIGKLMPFEDS
jgi:hypothetical protein